MRRSLIAGNWKMFKTIEEAKDIAAKLCDRVGSVNDRDIVVCPTFVCLSAVADVIGDGPIILGAQNMYFEESGAFTGEVSADILRSAGVRYVIIGHSERRGLFHETDDFINKKVHAALKKDLIPIFCIGEVLKERETGRTFDVIRTQVVRGLKDVSSDAMEHVVIAYEPVWAIGTGKTATPEQAQEVHAVIRSELVAMHNPKTATSVRILYGGSVKPNNIDTLMEQTDIDGALVGGASLKAEEFARIVQFEG